MRTPEPPINPPELSREDQIKIDIEDRKTYRDRYREILQECGDLALSIQNWLDNQNERTDEIVQGEIGNAEHIRDELDQIVDTFNMDNRYNWR